MNHVFAMQVFHSLDDLSDIAGDQLLFEPTNLIQNGVKVWPSSILQDDVDSFFIKEEPEHGENIRVIKMTVYLDLPSHPIPNVTVHQLFFIQSL